VAASGIDNRGSRETMKTSFCLPTSQSSPLALTAGIAILAFLVGQTERVHAIELAQATLTPPATNAYEQRVSEEAADFQPSGVPETGRDEAEQHRRIEPAGAPQGRDPERIDRIKAFVNEALAAPDKGQESRPTIGTPAPQSAPDAVTARRETLRALVDKQTELSSTQDARYLDKLRDEVSETMVFGEATRTQIVPPDDQGVVGAEGASGSYKVKPGDSLWKIAQDRYGDGYKWRRIYEANRDSLKDIDVLRIGQILTLPMP